MFIVVFYFFSLIIIVCVVWISLSWMPVSWFDCVVCLRTCWLSDGIVVLVFQIFWREDFFDLLYCSYMSSLVARIRFLGARFFVIERSQELWSKPFQALILCNFFESYVTLTVGPMYAHENSYAWFALVAYIDGRCIFCGNIVF